MSQDSDRSDETTEPDEQDSGADSQTSSDQTDEMDDAPGGISDSQLPEDLQPDGNDPEPAMDEHGRPRETDDEDEGMSLADREDV